MKTCNKCGEQKDIVEFHKKKDGRDGREAVCKKCAWRSLREKNQAEIRARKRAHENWMNLKDKVTL